MHRSIKKESQSRNGPANALWSRFDFTRVKLLGIIRRDHMYIFWLLKTVKERFIFKTDAKTRYSHANSKAPFSKSSCTFGTIPTPIQFACIKNFSSAY